MQKPEDMTAMTWRRLVVASRYAANPAPADGDEALLRALVEVYFCARRDAVADAGELVNHLAENLERE